MLLGDEKTSDEFAGQYEAYTESAWDLTINHHLIVIHLNLFRDSVMLLVYRAFYKSKKKLCVTKDWNSDRTNLSEKNHKSYE